MKYLCILIITAFSVLIFYNQEASPIAEKNIFVSPVFRDFSLAQGILESENALKLNVDFIQKLRSENEPQAIRNYYLGSKLTQAYKEYLYQLIPPFQAGDFFQYLRTSLTLLKNEGRFKKSKTTLTDDSSSEGNLPFLQFVLPGGTSIIRMGLPIVEQPYLKSLVFSPAVNPEFITFIRTQKKHLYINLMKREGLEAPYSQVLENLNESTFFIVTLDKNSSFYWQKGDFPSESEAFMELFYNKMKDPKGAYFLPRELNLLEAIEKVHLSYFDGKVDLNANERRNFIELTYLEILDRLVELIGPDSMNITCKHAIDRGPSLSVLWQLKWGLADEQAVAALLLAPPLLMHNRTPHESRIERFIEAANFFYPKKKGEDRIQ